MLVASKVQNRKPFFGRHGHSSGRHLKIAIPPDYVRISREAGSYYDRFTLRHIRFIKFEKGSEQLVISLCLWNMLMPFILYLIDYYCSWFFKASMGEYVVFYIVWFVGVNFSGRKFGVIRGWLCLLACCCWRDHVLSLNSFDFVLNRGRVRFKNGIVW